MDNDRELKRSVKEAEALAKDPKAVEVLANKAQEKSRVNEVRLRGLKKDLDSLVRLARAWAGGKYKDISWSSILVVLGAVVYFVNPFDALPDFIPLLGYSDDVSIIGLAILRVRSELNKFEDWEQEINLL